MFSRPTENVLEFGFMPGQKVADLGAGSGHYAAALAQVLGPEGRVYAVDIDKGSLTRLANTLSHQGKRNIDVIHGDIEETNGTHLKESLLDGVLLSNIIFLLEDKEAAATEAMRILKPNGRVVLVEWADKFTQMDAKELFHKVGLKFERVFEAGNHHYGMIFSK